MKRIALALCLALILLLAVGCGNNYPFSGTWKEEGTGTIYQFTNNDQLLVGENTESVAVGGSFEHEKDTDKLTITVAPPSGTKVSRVVTFSLNEDGSVLTLTDAQGAKSVLKKVQ